MIKEYADRIREEIKQVNKSIDEVRQSTEWSDVDSYNKSMKDITNKQSYINGLCKALDLLGEGL